MAGLHSDNDLERVLQLEVELLDPAVRADARRLEKMLHPHFVEHGASGRIWTRQAIIDELPLEGADTPRTTATDLVGAWIDANTILVTYRTASTLKCAVRSSIWSCDDAGQWQIRFHQGTLTDLR